MDENQAGITAMVTAYARAYHATHDDPKIFDDFLADQLFTPQEHTFFDQNLAGMLNELNPDLAATHPDPSTAQAWVMQTINGPITLSRSRYAEDNLERSISQGVQQYVILGAGLDTFAFRRPDLLKKLEVFEVDHPVTQALTRQRISEAGWQLPAQLHFVPVDFTKESLIEALHRSPFAPHENSFFSWLGVTYYLTREVIFATLQAIAAVAPQGSALVFDYMDSEATLPEKTSKRMQTMQWITRQTGEPMKTGFDLQELNADLVRLGFRLEEHLTPEDIEGRYFKGRSDNYHAFDHVHFARAVVA